MKKIFTIIFLSSLVSVSTTSCNKTYECECKSGGKVLSVTPIKTLGRMGAKSVCDSYQVQNNLNGSNEGCNLK